VAPSVVGMGGGEREGVFCVTPYLFFRKMLRIHVRGC